MTENTCRIICASAGTGKTYRLSLEYLALIMQFYGKPDFSLDSILVLTFTRKATAEIRERIVAHLDLLCSDAASEKKTELLLNLRHLVPSAQIELSLTETNLLLSAKQEIECDNSRMQVMTIDAYINHIFRNIVRPLRNIERYDIDTEAVDKIMPYLLDHLMKPEFRERLKKLLSRKVSKSLDGYRVFFGSLVKQRWLFYLITGRPQIAGTYSEQKRLCDLASRMLNTEALDLFHHYLGLILEQVNDLCRQLQKGQYPDYFNSEFRNFTMEEAVSPAAVMHRIKGFTPQKLEKLLGTIGKKGIWNGNKIRKQSFPAETALLTEALFNAQTALADHLLATLYLPEQHEILELWGLILKEYDRLIYRYKKLTYDDISWFTFEALFSQEPPFMDPASAVSATEFYQFLSHRTRFLLIDEFQDTSLIQFNILKPIIEEITSGEGSKPFGGLIVVGDEKQSIFGWRGGERDLLLNLQYIFPAISEVQTERLEKCWRCGPTLMQFINTVFQNEGIHLFLQKRRLSWSYQMLSSDGVLKSEPGAQVEFCIKNFTTTDPDNSSAKELIADFVKRMVKPAIDSDPNGSIAILCRKGKELAEIQLALDEAGITSLYQPDRSIIDHAFVSPLITWLRYVAWGDWMDYVAFLRSDYLRIGTTALKAILKCIQVSLEQSREHFVAPDFSGLPLAERLYEQAKLQRDWPATRICREMAENYLNHEMAGERDYLNLHKWLDLVAEWELNQTECSLPDFLTWVKDHSKSEEFKQVSISGEDSLQLLTFHKAKGLQFRRVFVFYNLSGVHREDSSHLQWALQYAGKDFQQLSDFGISYHYQKILKASSYARLWEAGENRELLEEMNNLYVAFTRAEKKLHLYFCYRSKENWAEYLQNKEENALPILVCKAAMDSFGEAVPDARGFYTISSLFPETPEPQKEPVLEEELSGEPQGLDLEGILPAIVHHSLLSQEALLPNRSEPGMNYREQWLGSRPNLIGDLLHHYLSFIVRNQPEEHEHAYLRCLLRFGAIFTREEIEALSQRAQQACEANSWLFAASWDKIFTEQELFLSGKALRLDRLMVATNEKKACIVDYKSGGVHDADQLSTYVHALSGLTALRGFQIDTEIIHI